MTHKLTSDTAIARRSFEVVGRPGEKVDIFIGKPEQLHEEEWICPYRIVGAGKDINFQIHGYDSVQVLQLIWKVIDGALIGAGLELLLDRQKFPGFTEEY